jgi:phosphoglycolate phosphatase
MYLAWTAECLPWRIIHKFSKDTGMRFKNIFLDLDGTISQSGTGIIRALNFMFNALSMEIPDEKELMLFIGPPVKYVLKEFGIVGETGEKAYAAFREYYEKTGIFEMDLYEGMEDMLVALKISGATVHVATGKREEMAEIALNHLKVRPYFKQIFGAEPQNNIYIKKDILKKAVETMGHLPEKSVMVGDRAIDIVGGRENGFATIGVLYGYGSEEEINASRPDFIVRDVAELKALLLEK